MWITSEFYVHHKIFTGGVVLHEFEPVEPDKLVVTQSNALALSAQKMTLQEKRLLLFVISHVRKDDDDFEVYDLPVTAIKEYLEIKDDGYYRKLENISEKLLSRVIKIKSKNGRFDHFQWVSKSTYFPKDISPIGVACLRIRLHEDLRPFLLQLREHFGSIPLRQIATIRSENSIRLAEILYAKCQKFKIKKFYISLIDLKGSLGLAPPVAKKILYPNFFDFKRKILERAKIDCAEKSPITFTYELEKKGKKVIGLYFYVTKNKLQTIIKLPPDLKDDLPLSQPEDQKEPQITQIPEEYEPLLKRIIYIGISESRANNDILKDQERATKAIEVAEGYLEKEDSDPRKIYSKAYSENWSKKSQHQIEKEENRKAYKAEEARKEAKNHFENEYITYKEEAIEIVRKNLSTDQLKELEDQAMEVGKQKNKQNKFGSVATFTRLELSRLLEKETNISTEDEWVENKMKAWEEKKNEKSSE